MPFGGFLGFSILIVLAANARAHAPKGSHVQAAESRQRLVQAMDIKFRRTEVVAPGGFSEKPQLAKYDKPVPAIETKIDSVSRLAIDGPKIRYEENHPHWRKDGDLNKTMTALSVFDGSMAKKLCLDKEHQPPLSTFKATRSVDTAKHLILSPIMMAFRGLDPEMNGHPLQTFKASGSRIPIGQDLCDEYYLPGSPDTTIRLWLDPSKDYLVQRKTIHNGTSLRHQLDISYRKEEGIGWVPDAWVKNEYSAKGRLLATTTVNVLESSYNRPLDKGEFDLSFPPGTFVAGGNDGKLFRVQPDGRMREVDGITGEPASSTVVSQPGDSWIRRHKWFMVASGVVGLLLLGFAVKRHLPRLVR
jgi:hypothetical protein